MTSVSGVRGLAGSAAVQCDIRTGTVMLRSTERVAPPSAGS